MTDHTNTLNSDPQVVLSATADLPNDQKDAIRWYFSHCLENGWNRKQAGQQIDYSSNTLGQIFTGTHSAGKGNCTKKILAYKSLLDSRAGKKKLSYIETALSRRVWEVCDGALAYQRIGFIFSDSQIGKTEALIEYKNLHPELDVVYIRMPEGGGLEYFMREVLKEMKLGAGKLAVKQMRELVLDAITSKHLLLIDEAHQSFNLSSRSMSIKPVRVLEFIREIFDRTMCGVVFCGTNTLKNEFETGRFSKLLQQLWRRRLACLQLENKPTKADLHTFAQAYGLEPAEDEDLELQSEVIDTEALGFWLTLLRMTAARCHRNSITMRWHEVHKSYAMLRKLEG